MDGGELRKLGENITNPQLAVTLEKIRDNPMSFYNGWLASEIVRDVKRAGGIITADDMSNYKVVWRKALKNNLGDMTWFTVPPPASGPVITMILNILKGKDCSCNCPSPPPRYEEQNTMYEML